MTKNSMALSRPYATMDDAALGGFKKVMTSFPDYKSYEYGFLVVSFDRPAKPNEITLAKVVPAVSILFPDTMPEYYYTTPVSDQEKQSQRGVFTV